MVTRCTVVMGGCCHGDHVYSICCRHGDLWRGMLGSKPGLAGTWKWLCFSVAVSPWWLMLSTRAGQEQVFSLDERSFLALLWHGVTICGFPHRPGSPYHTGVSPETEGLSGQIQSLGIAWEYSLWEVQVLIRGCCLFDGPRWTLCRRADCSAVSPSDSGGGQAPQSWISPCGVRLPSDAHLSEA